jgi:hypothetical protein
MVAKGRKGARSTGSLAGARTGLFRATLLFGSTLGALALIAVPEADRRAKLVVAERAGDVDPVVTGSVARPSGNDHYTLRRSVLDDPDVGPCIMFPDGRQKGSC